MTPQLSVEPSVSINRVSLTEGSFTSTAGRLARHLHDDAADVRERAACSTTRPATWLAANVRFRWEYRPGSELFVVFNEQRDTLPSGFPELANRAFIVKVNRLFRF